MPLMQRIRKSRHNAVTNPGTRDGVLPAAGAPMTEAESPASVMMGRTVLFPVCLPLPYSGTDRVRNEAPFRSCVRENVFLRSDTVQ